MKRSTNFAKTLELAAERAKYDECAKKILTYKVVIAWILKSCTKEFSKYSVDFICENCLTETVDVSKRAVHQDQLNADERLEGLNTEANSIREQTVYYDLRFKVHLPGEEDVIVLIVNLEIQLNDIPGYPLVTRGFYYCARMISEQYGTVFTDEHYEKIQKVYSIWICPDPAKKRKNGIFRYHTVEEVISGKSYIKKEAYDLMEVIILNLGDADGRSGIEILDLLSVLFSPVLSYVEKKKRLSEDFRIAMTAEFEDEVSDMCNLSKGVWEWALQQGLEQGIEQGIQKGMQQGIEQGIEQGMQQGIQQKNMSLLQIMLESKEPLDKIMKYTGYSKEKINEIAAMIGNLS